MALRFGTHFTLIQAATNRFRLIARISSSLAIMVVGLLPPLSIIPNLVFADGVDCRVAASAIREASQIRGLSIQRSVPCTIEDREHVKKFLLNAVQNKIPAEKMRADEFIAKSLGFFPEDFDYKDGIVNLYLSQLGGYYDPERKKYVMAGWLPQMMQPTVAVHELTHALQDQHFNLETFIDDIHFSTDRMLARAAVVEGDATAVMLDYQRGLIGDLPLSKVENVDAFVLQTVLGMALSTGSNPAPEALKAALLFPYASGIRFVHFLLRSGGYAAVTRAFAHPPESTEEVLHPEKFGKGDFREVSDGEISTESSGGVVVYSDTLGEFSMSALLAGSAAKREMAAAAAAGWAGDRAVIIREGAAERVLWVTRWDSERDAQEFYSAYREFLTGQSSSVEQSKEGAVQITVDSRIIALRRNGMTVIARVTREPQ